MRTTIVTALFLTAVTLGGFAQGTSRSSMPDDYSSSDTPTGTSQRGSYRDMPAPTDRPTIVYRDSGSGTTAEDTASPRLRKRTARTDSPNRVEPIVQDSQPSAEDANIVPEEMTEFQRFVFESVGRRLPIFGAELFTGVPSTFAPVDGVPVASDYVVGPGDELLIRGWGQADIDVSVVVARDGSIYIPKVGQINVTGIQYDQLRTYLKSNIGRVFRNFDLTVTMGQLRSIQVFVVGQARRPGSYTVSSLSTLVNALFASGGPSSQGSMRSIQLRRNGNIVTDFDLYDLLLKGDKSKDAALAGGDVIYIPPVGHLVAVAGSVNVPAIYELKGNTSLDEAIQFSGGLSTTADGQKVLVERIDSHHSRKVAEFSLDGDPAATALRNGDIIRIVPLSPKFENAVTLRGQVALPGRYSWRDGMRIRDLIPSRDSLLTRDYWRLQNAMTGTQPELTLDQLQKQLPGSLQAGPQQPGSQQVDEAKLRTDLKRNAADINWDYAVIQRMSPQDLSPQLIPFNLGHAISDPDSEDNRVLESGDVVTIFSQRDIQVPVDRRTKFVRLEGEFAAAGIYRLEPGESMRHLIDRTGGLTPKAYLFGAQLTREAVRDDQQQAFDKMVSDMDQQVERNAVSTGNKLLDASSNQNMLLSQQVEGQRRLVDKLRQVKPTGRIVMAVLPGASSVNDLPDIPLEDGDRILVPRRPDTIQVTGAVYNANSFLYREHTSVGDYLTAAGGVTKDGDKARIFVVRADGSVISSAHINSLWRGGIGHLQLFAGDTVVVPENLEKGAFMRGFKDWSQVISQFALGAAAVKVLAP